MPDQMQPRRRSKTSPERRERFAAEALADIASPALHRPEAQGVYCAGGRAATTDARPQGLEFSILFGGERDMGVAERLEDLGRSRRGLLAFIGERLRRPVQRDS